MLAIARQPQAKACRATGILDGGRSGGTAVLILQRLKKERAPEPAMAEGRAIIMRLRPHHSRTGMAAARRKRSFQAEGERPSPRRDEGRCFRQRTYRAIFRPVRSEPPLETAQNEEDGSNVTPLSNGFTAKASQAAQAGAQRIFESVASGAQNANGIIFAPKSTPQREESPEVDIADASEAEDDEDEEEADFSVALPPVSLLAAPPRESAQPAADDPALMQRAALLMSVLGDFGVKGRISGIYPGPVITLFELEPARGTKSSRVVGLADDIARSMSAISARVAVVPGRDAIGIELPNAKREIVSLRGMFKSSAFQMSQASLPLALGKSIGGEPIVADLARMPHLLIAGTTGSGKSVGINTMILSLLYRLPPSQCNFIMIDPKMLELSVYDGIPHLLAPVVTDPKKAIAALKWTVKEMNARYERMCKLGVRNITSYNAKAAAAQLRGQPLRRVVQTGFDPRTDETDGRGRNIRAGIHALSRRCDRRNGGPYDGGGKRYRVCRAASLADGACGGHSSYHGDATAKRGCCDRHDQGQLPKPHQLSSHVQDRQPHHHRRAGRGTAPWRRRHALYGGWRPHHPRARTFRFRRRGRRRYPLFEISRVSHPIARTFWKIRTIWTALDTPKDSGDRAAAIFMRAQSTSC